MAEERRRLPVGLIIATPPVLAGLYLVLYLVVAFVLRWPRIRIAEAPLEAFEKAVYAPLMEIVGCRCDFRTLGFTRYLLVFGLVWVGSFFVAGLLLGALAALVNAVVLGGGGDGRKG